MKLFSEKVKKTFTNSNHNILQVENFSEIFFNVFEIEINKSKYPVEKISEYEGNPVVSVPVLVEGAEIFYPFILIRGKFELLFNENNTLGNLFPDDNLTSIKEVPVFIDEQIEFTLDGDKFEYLHEEIIDNKKNILAQIEKAKKNASDAIKKDKALKLKQISEAGDKQNSILQDTLEKARENLVDEFIIISDKLRKELASESKTEYSELKETIDNKLSIVCEELKSQLKDNFDNASNIFDSKITTLVKELYLEMVSPKVEKELNNIALQIVEKVEEIETTLDKKLETKAEKTLVEGVSKELLVIQQSNIELNDNINKGINKALSRAGNVKTLVEKIDKEINEKISTELSNIENYFDERIQNIQEQTFDITEESRKYIIDLVNKSKVDLLEEIRKIPTEKPVEYIIESNKKDPEKVNLDKLKKEYDTIIHNKFENYKTDLRKYISVYSGGGSVAMQFADGGTMNGNLTVVGAISASQYLGLPSGSGGSDVSGLSANWQSTYNTVSALSSTWGTSTPSGSANSVQYNDNGIFGGIPNNTTSSQLFLSQVSDGVPSWQPIPALGAIVYYFTPFTSDVVGYFKETSAPYPTLSSFSATVTSSGQLLRTYVSEPLNPYRTSIPDGQYSCHIHATRTSGTQNVALRAEIWEVSNTGVDIGLIATLGNSVILTGVVAEYFISEQIPEYTLTSTSSRIATKIYATTIGSGSNPTVQISVGDGTDSRTNLPSPVIDSSNYLPYSGATTNLDLGSYDISGDGATFNNINVTSISAAEYLGLPGNDANSIIQLSIFL